jgi:hypothetical protein
MATLTDGNKTKGMFFFKNIKNYTPFPDAHSGSDSPEFIMNDVHKSSPVNRSLTHLHQATP